MRGSTAPCRLKLHTEACKLDLEGDAEFVRKGYLAMRGAIRARTGADPEALAASQPTEIMYATSPQPSIKPADTQFVWVYRCDELYTKVHVLERARLQMTRLCAYVDPTRLNRIYLDGSTDDALDRLVPRGETLWSELTAALRGGPETS